MSVYIFRLPIMEQISTGIDLSDRITKSVQFADEKGRIWLEISPSGEMKINTGYAWDGCSPKYRVLGRIIGIWDGFLIDWPKDHAWQIDISGRGRLPQTWLASLAHDALCQFKRMEHMPFTEAEIHLIFLQLLKKANFKLAYPYYYSVVAYGYLEGKLND